MDNPEVSGIEEAIRKEEESYVEDAGEGIRKKVVANGGQFSETLRIKPNGFLDLTDEQGGLKSYFAHVANAGRSGAVEELYKLAFKVQERIPQLAFTFERDTGGQSITYTVKENVKK